MIERLSVTALLALSSLSLAAAPGPPQNLAAAVSGSTVTLTWIAPSTGDVPSSYVVEASFSPGGPAIASLPVAGTALVAPNVPNGVYHVRVRGVNAEGAGSPSNEVTVVAPGGVGGCAFPPGPPQNLAGGVNGSLVTLTWGPPGGGCAPASYAVQAGSAPGLSDITVANVGGATTLNASAPSGLYYVRAVALNPFGASGPSNEITVRVGASSPPPPPPPVFGQFAVATTAVLGWTSIEVFANGNSIGTLTRYVDPGAPSSCLAVPGGRVVTTLLPGTVAYTARSNTGLTWSGTAQVTAHGCREIQLTCPNRDCSAPPPPPPPEFGQFAVSTTAVTGWTSIEVIANGKAIGTLTTYLEPGTATSCVAVAGSRVVASVPPGTVTYSARSDAGATWSGTTQVSAGGCKEIQLTCANRNCSAAAPAAPPGSVPDGRSGAGSSPSPTFPLATPIHRPKHSS